MTHFAGKSNPGVSRAWPVGQPPILRVASRRRGPPARWIAPSTPPPPRSELLAALTIASTRCAVMSPFTSRIRRCCGTAELYDRAVSADVPDASDRSTLEALRAALGRAGLTAERVEERLGTHELSS